jgi:hypothetical protein
LQNKELAQTSQTYHQVCLLAPQARRAAKS